MVPDPTPVFLSLLPQLPDLTEGATQETTAGGKLKAAGPVGGTCHFQASNPFPITCCRSPDPGRSCERE